MPQLLSGDRRLASPTSVRLVGGQIRQTSSYIEFSILMEVEEKQKSPYVKLSYAKQEIYTRYIAPVGTQIVKVLSNVPVKNFYDDLNTDRDIINIGGDSFVNRFEVIGLGRGECIGSDTRADVYLKSIKVILKKTENCRF